MAEDYFSHPRPELRALVPAGARFVVDVGCGAGAMGAALKRERPDVQVRGIEPDRAAAARAAEVLDDVAVTTADGEPPPSWPAPDCVVFGDVLEHLIDPWAALRRWRSRLPVGACVIVSVPNVAHGSVLDALRRGRWDYEEEGILDRTHLRFFTRATATELVEQAGFRVELMRRAIELPTGVVGAYVEAPLLQLGAVWEERGGRVPRWLVARMDGRSRQVLLRARAAPGERRSAERT